MKLNIKSSKLKKLEEHIQACFSNKGQLFPAGYHEKITDSILKNGLPTRKHEDWQYYPFENLLPFTTEQSLKDNLSKNQLIKPSLDKAVFINVARQTTEGDLPQGLTVSFTNQAPASLQSANQELLAHSNDDPLLMLNQIFVDYLVTIKLDKNIKLNVPVVINFPEASVEKQLSAVQVNVDIASGSELTVIELHQSSTTYQAVNSAVVTFEVAENANCKHFCLYKQSPHSQNFWHGLANVQRYGNFESNTLLQGSDIVRRFQSVQLLGEGANSIVNSAYKGSQNQIIDSRSLTRHLAPNTESNQIHQGLLDDSAIGGFSGMIYVNPDALKIYGQMDNNVLILSDKAQNNSKPQLEIYADDVKCSHGFTCGRMDSQQLFYMQSRGIPLEVAKQQLINAFLAKVTDFFPEYLLWK